MAQCPSCRADGFRTDARCAECGYAAPGAKAALPDLELDIPQPPPKPIAPRKQRVEEAVKLELAVDLTPSNPPPAPRIASVAPASPMGGGGGVGTVAPFAPVRSSMRAPSAAGSGVVLRGADAAAPDDEMEVRALADYGDAPKTILFAPTYAYKVFARQRELKRALEGRREERAQAETALEDAMIACADRVRARAAKEPAYKPSLEQIAQAEALLRSRDAALAKEQDAHAERLASIDLRMSKIEEELAAAQAAERAATAELAEVEAAVQRAEAKMKRAEIELRNATAAAAPKASR